MPPLPPSIYFTLSVPLLLHAFTSYIGYPAACEGPSMLPTLAVQGDWFWVSTRHRRGRGIRVGDVVSFRHPWEPEEMASKRVLGLPGDFVLQDTPPALRALESGEGRGAQQDGSRGSEPTGELSQAMMVQVPEGHCWLAGDNSPWSKDSRDYGPQPLGLIRGKVTARIWPWARRKWVENTLREVKD